MARDGLILSWLQQNTERDEVLWRENELGKVFTVVGSIEITRASIFQRTGSLLCFVFTIGSKSTSIVEPQSDGLFKKRYDTEEKQELVTALYSLSKEISNQLERINKFNQEHGQEIKQEILSKLLSGL